MLGSISNRCGLNTTTPGAANPRFGNRGSRMFLAVPHLRLLPAICSAPSRCRLKGDAPMATRLPMADRKPAPAIAGRIRRKPTIGAPALAWIDGGCLDPQMRHESDEHPLIWV